jgi:UPF0755 protein
MKKLLYFLGFLSLIATFLLAFIFLKSGTAFVEKSKTFIINNDEINQESVVKVLSKNQIINSSFLFNLVANNLNIYQNIRPGKYKIANGATMLDIAKILKNNQQVEVNFVINKIRVVEDFAKLIAKYTSTDSATALSILQDPKTFEKINATPDNFLTKIIPNTYNFYWNTSVDKILEKLNNSATNFWAENNRISKAQTLGLSIQEIATIASIVEEETNKDDEKGNIASVYINRMQIGMALGADPTIKFALKDFTLKRILFEHLKVPSPYNTYINKGLPPGPICTPSIKTIDAVLNAPKTNFLFFVANASLDGHHHFSINFAEHQQYAKLYQAALTEFLNRKNK